MVWNVPDGDGQDLVTLHIAIPIISIAIFYNLLIGHRFYLPTILLVNV